MTTFIGLDYLLVQLLSRYHSRELTLEYLIHRTMFPRVDVEEAIARLTRRSVVRMNDLQIVKLLPKEQWK